MLPDPDEIISSVEFSIEGQPCGRLFLHFGGYSTAKIYDVENKERVVSILSEKGFLPADENPDFDMILPSAR